MLFHLYGCIRYLERLIDLHFDRNIMEKKLLKNAESLVNFARSLFQKNYHKLDLRRLYFNSVHSMIMFGSNFLKQS